jgi:hypothetical protein
VLERIAGSLVAAEAPDMPLDTDVLTEDELNAYAVALQRNASSARTLLNEPGPGR